MSKELDELLDKLKEDKADYNELITKILARIDGDLKTSNQGK